MSFAFFTDQIIHRAVTLNSFPFTWSVKPSLIRESSVPETDLDPVCLGKSLCLNFSQRTRKTRQIDAMCGAQEVSSDLLGSYSILF